jgi:uncharacterized protein (TIGR02996 family)
MPERFTLHWEPVLAREQPRGTVDLTWKWSALAGRAKDCDVVLKHPSIPNHHGRFLRLRNQWWIEDEHSPNGIYVDGRRIQRERVGLQPVDFAMIVRFRLETTPMKPEELRLLEAIHGAPDDDSRFLVYSDWLQEQGDPLGPSMVSREPVPASWLGPLAFPGLAARSRHGFFETLKIRSSGSVGPGIFEEALLHPLARFLRALEIDAVLLAAETAHRPDKQWVWGLFEALRTFPPLNLRTLKIRLPNEHWPVFEAEFRALKKQLPALATELAALFTEGALTA